jgi:small subunit ribosomal protein S3
VGQKTHPLAFRLGVTQKHLSSWVAKPSSYVKFAEEDFKIRTYIEKHYPNSGICKIHITRKLSQIEVNIYTSRPGVFVNKSNNELTLLRAKLGSLFAETKSLRINVIEVTNVDFEAELVADYICQQLEKRVAFRRVVRQTLKRVQRSGVPGIKIQVGGRLNGAEIARTEWVREGRVPLQTLRANLSYSSKRAETIYGTLGIKIWIFRGEVFA